MARLSLLLDTSLRPAVTSGGKKLRWSQFSQVTWLCLQRVHLKQWSGHWAPGSGVHRVVGTDTHLMTVQLATGQARCLTLFSLSRESQLLKLCPQLCPAYSVWPWQLPFINWLVLRFCCPQACPTVVRSQGPPQGQPALWCLYVACASVRESQAVFASIPASAETVTCVGRVTTGRDRPPQSRVVPDLQFCPGSQGRADQTSKPPQGTAHCTAPHGLLQLLLLGASHSQ